MCYLLSYELNFRTQIHGFTQIRSIILIFEIEINFVCVPG